MFAAVESGKGNRYYLFSISQTLLSHHSYKVCYDVLTKLKIEDLESEGERYKFCVTLGMLYGVYPSENPYYDPALAIKHYCNALAYSPPEEEEGEKGVVWFALAKLYFDSGEYGKAREACVKAQVSRLNFCSHLFAELVVNIREKLEER